MQFRGFLKLFRTSFSLHRRLIVGEVVVCMLLSKFCWAVGLTPQAASRVCEWDKAQHVLHAQLPGENDYAQKLLINCTRVEPKNTQVMLALAALYEQEEGNSETSRHNIRSRTLLISQAYLLEPNNPAVRFSLAKLFMTMGETQQAQELFELTLHQFPNHKESLLEQANLLSEKQPIESFKFVVAAVKAGALNTDVAGLVMRYAQHTSAPGAYAQTLVKLAHKFPSKDIYQKLGLVFVTEKRYAHAAEAFKQALAFSGTIDSRLQLAILQYQNLKEARNSVTNFKIILNDIEKNHSLSATAESLIYAHYSLALYEDKKIKNASVAALEVARRSFENHRYLESLVTEYATRGAMSVMRDALRQVTLDDPLYATGHALLGQTYAADKDYENALSSLDNAIIIEPKNEVFNVKRGEFYDKLSLTKHALQDLNLNKK